MSEAAKGRTFSVESRQKISAAHKGRKHSIEHRLKVGAASSARRYTAEQRRNMSEAQRRRPRRTVCKQGHDLTLPENQYAPPKRPGNIKCRPCSTARSAKWQAMRGK
jgi:hypothetical protein